jgi:hypothetical protein
MFLFMSRDYFWKMINRRIKWGLLLVELFFTADIIIAQWNHLAPDIYGPVGEIVINGNEIYIAGIFYGNVGDPGTEFVLRWDGCQWNSLAPGIDSFVNTILVSGNDIYVGGVFTQPFNNVARWDGVQWNAMGGGPGGPVFELIKSGGYIFACGGEGNSGFVSKWDGNSWTTMGPLFNSPVYDLATDEVNFYAGGRFTDAGGNPDADGIVQWEDGAWQNLGAGINPGGGWHHGVIDIEINNSNVYAGGSFISAGNQPAYAIVQWDGTNWINIGAGIEMYYGIHVLAFFNGYLHTTIGAGWYPEIDGIHRYDPVLQQWEVFQTIEMGADDPLLALSADESNLYVGGWSGMVIEGEDYGDVARYGESSIPGIVSSLNDAGPGTLRQMILCASDGDTISFSLPPESQITLQTGEIVIDKNLTLMGSGINDLVISGNNASRIFHLIPNKTLRLEQMALKNATSFTNGGAVFSEGTLKLKNILFENNFQNGARKSLTLKNGTFFEIMENVICKN